MAVGFTAHAGLRYRVISNVAVFGEWKFNWANLEHTNLAGTGLNFDGNYHANMISFGVGYHF